MPPSSLVVVAQNAALFPTQPIIGH